MLTGEYSIALDEKGRALIPSRLKSELDTSVVVITKASDSRKCLQIMKCEAFAEIAKVLSEDLVSSFTSNNKILQMRVIAPAQEVQFDKAGRIMIPQSLRTFASLDLKSEIVLIGMMDRLEVWNKEEYEKCLLISDDPKEIEKAALSLNIKSKE